MLRRTLDDLYWVMSYSRWKDERFWPLFRQALLDTHPQGSLQRPWRVPRPTMPSATTTRGSVVTSPIRSMPAASPTCGWWRICVGDRPFLFGDVPHGIDAAAYGFLANSWFFAIDTPLRQFIGASGNLAPYCERVRRLMTG